MFFFLLLRVWNDDVPASDLKMEPVMHRLIGSKGFLKPFSVEPLLIYIHSVRGCRWCRLNELCPLLPLHQNNKLTAWFYFCFFFFGSYSFTLLSYFSWRIVFCLSPPSGITTAEICRLLWHRFWGRMPILDQTWPPGICKWIWPENYHCFTITYKYDLSFLVGHIYDQTKVCSSVVCLQK